MRGYVDLQRRRAQVSRATEESVGVLHWNEQKKCLIPQSVSASNREVERNLDGREPAYLQYGAEMVIDPLRGPAYYRRLPFPTGCQL